VCREATADCEYTEIVDGWTRLALLQDDVGGCDVVSIICQWRPVSNNKH